MVQLPSVSTVIRLLHNTLFFARAFAITERDMVTDAGKPSGMKATITETTSIMRTGTVMKPLCCLSSQAPQRMMTITAIVRAQLAMMITNLRISRCKVVRPGASPVDNLAIRPLKHYGKSGKLPTNRTPRTYKTVESPVWITIPRPDPPTQELP
jgi:hypothetical protein